MFITNMRLQLWQC